MIKDNKGEVDYEDGDLPFGTCDYMAIDDMIYKLKELKEEIK